MSNLRFLEDEDKFLKIAYDVLKKYFSSCILFRSFYKKITDYEKKNKFLQTISMYFYFVKSGDFVNKENRSIRIIDYINDTYKFISLISLIEFLYEENKYIDFYQWLKKGNRLSKKNKDIQYLESNVDELYKEYKKKYGAYKRLESFLENLDNGTKIFLKEKFRFIRSNNQKYENVTLKRISKELYDFRSNYVHNSKIISQISGTSTIYKNLKNFIVVTDISIQDFCVIFERGFLKYFGFDEKFPLQLFHGNSGY